MPYREPRKKDNGWVLPKKSGGTHRSSRGKVVTYKSKESAKSASRAIMASEHGWKPRGMRSRQA